MTDLLQTRLFAEPCSQSWTSCACCWSDSPEDSARWLDQLLQRRESPHTATASLMRFGTPEPIRSTRRSRRWLLHRGSQRGAGGQGGPRGAIHDLAVDLGLAISRSGMACVAPHDQRVFAVVGVVAAPQPAYLEAELLVEVDRIVVRNAHLERVAAALVVARQLEERSSSRVASRGAGAPGRPRRSSRATHRRSAS